MDLPSDILAMLARGTGLVSAVKLKTRRPNIRWKDIIVRVTSPGGGDENEIGKNGEGKTFNL